MLLKIDLIRRNVLPLAYFGLMFLACASQDLAADDLVFLKKSAIVSRSRYIGKIEEYNAIKLTLVNPAGKKLEIDSRRISHVQTEFSSLKLKADRFFKEKKFGVAFEQYEKAIPNEKREWIRRRVYLRTQVRGRMPAWVGQALGTRAPLHGQQWQKLEWCSLAPSLASRANSRACPCCPPLCAGGTHWHV